MIYVLTEFLKIILFIHIEALEQLLSLRLLKSNEIA